MNGKSIYLWSLVLSVFLLLAAAPLTFAQTTTPTTSCGACRDPNNAQDRSYCDPTTNQCVRQIEPCPEFFIGADGKENLCQSNYGTDPSTGQCLYRAKTCIPDGCLEEACDPTDGVCKDVTSADNPQFILCLGRDDTCTPAEGGCARTDCRYQVCRVGTTDPTNCDSTVSVQCDTTDSTCQIANLPPSQEDGINEFSCQLNNGCVYTAVSCQPPSNPCEELYRDPNAPGCCTYRPRDCAAEYGNNPSYTYSCDPAATSGVCQATLKPEACNGADDNGDGGVDEGFPDTDGDGRADCVDPDDDDDGVPDATDNCPLVSNANQADFDRDRIGDICDPGTGPPVDKDQCKNGGWMRFDTPRRFTNEGDCIRFVKTGK